MLSQHKWIRNPFTVTDGEKISQLFIKPQESLMELPCVTSLKIKFEALPFPDFFIYIRNEYVELSQLAIDFLILFGTTYPCKKLFQQ
jgi:hypothetical protein